MGDTEWCRETIIKKSRKEHKCEVCSKIIPVGSKYKRINAFYEGNYFEDYICDDCDTWITNNKNLIKKWLPDGYSWSQINELKLTGQIKEYL